MMENVNGLSLDLIIHPGETIKEVLNEKNMNQEELAIRTGFSAKHISQVISGKKNISNRFAVSLEYALGISSSFWINLQGIYDKEIFELEKQNSISNEEYEVLEELKEVVKYCTKYDIISMNNEKSIQILNMRKFLNINDLTQIPNLPLQQVAFRGTKNKVNIYVLYAWQKICQFHTDKIDLITPFNIEKLSTSYTDIKKSMFLEGDEMILELKRIFKECGIVFEIVKHFKGAPVQGYIQKIDNKVILCMTIRQSFCDIFWFTLFHEIAHLIYDDFSNQFIDYTFIESDIEKRANDFASNVLIDNKDYNNFLNKGNFDIESIQEFSNRHNIKPGILIGRMQRDMNNYSFLTEYREQYKWAE